MKRRFHQRKKRSEVAQCTLAKDRVRQNLSKGLNRYGLKIEEYWVDNHYIITPDLEWKIETHFGLKVFKFPEPIRPVVYKKKTVPGYYIAESGNAYSAFCGKGMGRGREVAEGKEIIDNLRLLSPSTSKMHRYFHLRVPPKFYDYEYRTNGKSQRQVLSVQVHQIVMQTWRPVNDYPPEKIKHVWDQTPIEIKNFIADCLFTNHIDHDPYNNNVDNLEYCTPMHNARESVKHWGGNNANKKKILESKGEPYIGFHVQKIEYGV